MAQLLDFNEVVLLGAVYKSAYAKAVWSAMSYGAIS